MGNLALIFSELPPLLVIGLSVFGALYVGKVVQLMKLPSIIGHMIMGVVLGPSVLSLLGYELQASLGFVSEIALGFVALSIGLELSFATLKRQGIAMIVIIFSESVLTFFVVAGALYLLTRNLPFSILFGAIAPASAPAGTVAIIQEYRARGPVTQALYSVVGFDDGLGIVIYAFAAAVAMQLLTSGSFAIANLIQPLIEIGGSLAVGSVVGILVGLLAKRLSSDRDVLILIFAAVALGAGISTALGLSLILTNLMIGILVVNTQPRHTGERIGGTVSQVMPLLFTLFFVLAGANLEISALPALGLIGLVYMVSRSVGLIGGAWFGALIGGADAVIRKYVGLGILSQAGVAIGLALDVQRTFSSMGETGEWIGRTIITSVTATSILFGIIGPILTKYSLEKAGEIDRAA